MEFMFLFEFLKPCTGMYPVIKEFEFKHELQLAEQKVRISRSVNLPNYVFFPKIRIA